jgi:cytochrome c peroxidase
MGGPVVPWRSGRQDLEEKSINPLPDGRLPNANMGCPHATNAHIRDIFGRMGFNDRETVALIGAHAVGRCHTDASGFWGPWTNAETTFSNEYFRLVSMIWLSLCLANCRLLGLNRLLVEEKWTQKKTHQGKAWTGPMQYEDKTGNLMMLPADLWLVEDKAFKTYVDLYAKDENAFFQDFAAAFSKLLELGVKF